MPVSERLAALRQRYFHHAPVRPAYAAALRTSLLTAAPILLAVLLGEPALAWVGIAAWIVTQADVGGAYATRAASMGAVALGGATLMLATWLLAAGTLTAALWMCVTAFGLGLLRALGNAGRSVGLLLTVMVVIALGSPVPPAAALTNAASYLAGGALAMLVALGLWRLHPFKPVRLAAAACYERLAAAIAALGAQLGGHGDGWDAMIRREHRALRESIETARQTLLGTQLGRGVDTARSSQMASLVEIADRAFEACVALSETLEGAEEAGRDVRALQGPLEALAAQFACVAAELRRSGGGEGARACAALLPAQASAGAGPYATSRLERLTQLAAMAAETLAGRDPTLASAPGTHADARAIAASGVAALRANWTLRSRVFRHALRVGLATALTVVLTRWLHIEQGAWITITTLVILQPSFGDTWVKAVQRVLGTLVGGVLVALVASWHWPPLFYPFAIAVALFWGFALQKINYAYFIMLITPAFVLLARLVRPDWHLALLRLDTCLVGVAIALACAFVFWPTREHESARVELAKSLAAARAFFEAVFDPLLTGAPVAPEAYVELRRRCGLAHTNAEDAVQRLLDERADAEPVRSAYFVLTTHLRRFTAVLITLLPLRRALAESTPPEELRAFADTIDAALGAMQRRLESDAAHEEPGLWTRLPLRHAVRLEDAATEIPQDAAWRAYYLERLRGQVATMARALDRITAPVPAATPLEVN